ncbi:MAG: redoxin domain-containing protein [Pirellulales bacterium]|nr:redoxin domain-containing protein [Pirellulales bacterium]
MPRHGSRLVAHAAPVRFLLSLLVAATCLVGCNPSKPAEEGEAKPMQGEAKAANLSADALLKNMATVYRHAKTYSDSGRLRFKLLRGEDNIDETADFSVTFERPAKVRMHLYQAIVISDGKLLHSTVGDLEGQVLEIEAPEAISLESLVSDEVLASVINEGVAGPSPQLGLLLADDAIDGILTGAKGTKLLDPQGIDGRLCSGVEIQREDGRLIFWIDRESFVVRRIEFPTDALREVIGGGADVKELALWADLSGAVIDSKIDAVAFKFEMPEQAKVVQRFDTRPLLPKPPAPSKLLGQMVGDFKFKGLDGKEISRDSLAGKVVILDFWATWCGPCMESLPNLNAVYEKYQEHPGVQFLAVSIDETDVTEAQIKESFAKIGVSLPIARDTQTAARNVFQVEGIPNMFVIGPDGKVQDNDVGFNPRIAAELPGKIEKLLAGKSIYEDTIRQYEQRLAEYDAAMAQPLGQADANGNVRAEIAAASSPSTFTLTEAWQSQDVTEPGNIIVVADQGTLPRLLVNEGWKGVAELGVDGKVIAKHQPAIADSAVISFIRSGVGRDGKRLFAVAATTQPRAYVFDQDWKLVLSHPTEDGREVADVELADLEGDGTLELVTSYWGNAGVDVAAVDGRVLFTNTDLENPFRVAISAPDATGHRRLLCANTRGTVAPIDHTGKSGAEVAVGKRFLRYIVAEDLDGDGRPELCGIAATTAGGETLVGFTEDGSELWSYPLPAGLHQQPIEMIAAGRIVGPAKQWIVAGADGSIHLIAADGQPLDKFSTGGTLTGIAAGEIEGKNALFVSTTDGIRAWTIEEGTPAAGKLIETSAPFATEPAAEPTNESDSAFEAELSLEGATINEEDTPVEP